MAYLLADSQEVHIQNKYKKSKPSFKTQSQKRGEEQETTQVLTITFRVLIAMNVRASIATMLSMQ